MPSNFADVKAFHVKFGLPCPEGPQLIDGELLKFRTEFMDEELDEFMEAMCLRKDEDGYLHVTDGAKTPDLARAFDALLDLVYVAMGTAVLMGLPWQAGWDEVQRANMSKIRCERPQDSKRGTTFDVIKPDGWRAPNIEGVIIAYQSLLLLRRALVEMNRATGQQAVVSSMPDQFTRIMAEG